MGRDLGYEQRKKRLEADGDQFEIIVIKIEKLLSSIPILGNILALFPCLLSLLRANFQRDYKQIPYGGIILLIFSGIYIIYPIDLISDYIPFFGYLDDFGVLYFVLDSMEENVEEYRQWQIDNDIRGKHIN